MNKIKNVSRQLGDVSDADICFDKSEAKHIRACACVRMCVFLINIFYFKAS